MDWLAENWFWALVLVLFVIMHMFGHGEHGSLGGHEKQEDYENKGQK